MAAKPIVKAARYHGLASRAKPVTDTQKNQFLVLIAEGKNRAEAADAVGEKGSRFRAMVREGTATYDADFAAQYAEARAIADEAIDDLLDAEGLRRQLGIDPATKTDRGLHNERIYRSPRYRAAHRQAPTVNVTTEMEITHVHVEGAADGLRAKLAPVIELRAAGDAETRDR